MAEDFEKTAKVVQCNYQLLADLHRVLARMSRKLRFTVGVELTRLAGTLMDELVLANQHHDPVLRLNTIKRAQAYLSSLRLRLRLIHELKVLSTGQNAVFNRDIETISKQLASWRKWAQSQHTASKS